ncbi:hypothetical protein [uncultured Gimesia sp.]|uniref:hypothetical protein n=1 Tax=uncultured Gimesia sp. TaxID=1678688 RepID=UPI0030DA253F|tara:strand:- start:19873 stop:20466 length:594 start_codon:yes stop_codon:yes gene_type:complete
MADKPMRCPTPVCTGWISFVKDEDGDFWGCGECGEVWFEQDDLNDAIKEIISTYEYRKPCYQKSGKNWVAAPLKKEPEDYEELVENEDYPDDDDEEEELGFYCCPTWGCFGMVVWCDDGGNPEEDDSGWYCDHCGDSWPTNEKFFKQIAKIIKRGPHRTALYEQTDEGWQPLGEPDDWERVVTKNEEPLKEEGGELF